MEPLERERFPKYVTKITISRGSLSQKNFEMKQTRSYQARIIIIFFLSFDYHVLSSMQVQR